MGSAFIARVRLIPLPHRELRGLLSPKIDGQAFVPGASCALLRF